MIPRTSYSGQILPIVVSVAGLCMTALSLSLLVSAASLGVFMHKMLGFIGVIFVNSVILSIVAIRIVLSRKVDVDLGEKIFVMGLSLCTGVALVIAHTSDS